MKRYIEDPYFKVVIDSDATSPNVQRAIWKGQNTCVSEIHWSDKEVKLSAERCGEAVIKHQLEGDRGHYSVLNKAFISIGCVGFPHSLIGQITRHHESSFLVQSGRYTGDRFVKAANGEIPIEEVFYFRPVGTYFSRGVNPATGSNRYEYTQEQLDEDKRNSLLSAIRYADAIANGFSEEHARELLTVNYRQNFDMSGTVKEFWHWWDQRSKADAQIEIQTFYKLVFDVVYPTCPQLCQWYQANREGKARLAP